MLPDIICIISNIRNDIMISRIIGNNLVSILCILVLGILVYFGYNGGGVWIVKVWLLCMIRLDLVCTGSDIYHHKLYRMLS